MISFIKMIAVLAIAGIVLITSLFVLDFVTVEETREMLTKAILVLGIIALGGLATSFLLRPRP